MTRIGKMALAAAAASGVLAPLTVVAAPISINSGAFSYSENFDSLISNPTTTAVTAAWANSSTINGWVAFQSLPTASTGATHTAGRDPLGTGSYLAVSAYRADSGASNTGALYSHGPVGSSDRALGSVGSGTPGDFFWGVEFTNNSGGTIDSITVSYRGEQWRNGATTANTLEFDYSRTATSYSDNAAFTAVAALNFTSPNIGATAGAIDGNDPLNSANIGPIVIGSLGLLPGETLRLRWFDDDHAGSDQGLAIDNFSFQAAGGVTPEPASLGLLAVAGLGMLSRRRK